MELSSPLYFTGSSMTTADRLQNASEGRFCLITGQMHQHKQRQRVTEVTVSKVCTWTLAGEQAPGESREQTGEMLFQNNRLGGVYLKVFWNSISRIYSQLLEGGRGKIDLLTGAPVFRVVSGCESGHYTRRILPSRGEPQKDDLCNALYRRVLTPKRASIKSA